jgi:hypothetical protein
MARTTGGAPDIAAFVISVPDLFENSSREV